MSSLVPSPPCEKWSRRQTRKPKGKLPMQLILQSQYTENPHNAYICGSLTSKFVVYSLTDVLRVVGCWCIVVVRWTRQLPLGFPFTIIVSNTMQKQTSHNHCLSSLSAIRVTTLSQWQLWCKYFFGTLLSYTITRACAGQRNSPWLTKPFLCERVRSGDKTTIPL